MCYDDEKWGDNMNCLEAERFFDSYIDFLASRTRTYTLCAPISKIPFYCDGWKEKLLDASKLDVARRLLWKGECPNGYIESIEQALLCVPSIIPVPDSIGYELMKASEIVAKGKDSKFFSAFNKNKINEAEKLLFKHQPQIEPFDISSFQKFCEHMIQYIDDVFLPSINAEVKNYPESVFQYCMEAYETAGIPYEQNYDIYFYSIRQMQEWAMDPKMKNFFKDYEDVLFDTKGNKVVL